MITGASSGIGAAAAERLAKAGHPVFAGVHNERDSAAVAAIDNRITPVIINVTNRDTIAAAARTTRASPSPDHSNIYSAPVASIIEPGAVMTPIWQKGKHRKDELARMMPPQALKHYGDAVEAGCTASGCRGTRRPAGQQARRGYRRSTDRKEAEGPLWCRHAGANANLSCTLPEGVRDRLIRKAMGLS